MRRPASGTTRTGSDLDLVELVVIDGDNLLHAVRGSRDAGGVAWLLPRLKAWRPPGVGIVVALDGHPGHGLGDRRPIAPGISVRHAGARSADDLIVSLLEQRPYAERSRTVVVTDDGPLLDRVRQAGSIGRRVAWLTHRMNAGEAATTDRQTGPNVGRRSGPRPSGSGWDDSSGEAERPWRPGRGATRKIGNPKRSPRSTRGAGGTRPERRT